MNTESALLREEHVCVTSLISFEANVLNILNELINLSKSPDSVLESGTELTDEIQRAETKLIVTDNKYLKWKIYIDMECQFKESEELIATYFTGFVHEKERQSDYHDFLRNTFKYQKGSIVEWLFITHIL